jgi:hypothetical protein
VENATNLRTIQGKWAGRFIWAAVIQGLIAAIVTVLILDPLQYLTGNADYYSPAKVIAANGAGTWLFTGYISFIVVGVVAVAVTAIFYFYIEGIMGKVYTGLTNYLAWAHLVFMNVGVAGGMLLMIWGGYTAGYASAPVSSGGEGLTSLQIHEQILGQLTDPIGALVLLAVLGALFGGLGYILRSRTR